MMIDKQRFFQEWVRRQRRKLGLTQAELGRQAHCSAATVRSIERGNRRPSPALAHALAKALQIPTQELERFLEFGTALPPPPLPAATEQPEAQPEPHPTAPTRPYAGALMPLIGRAAEVQWLTQQLTSNQTRLLTLVGLGGVGKTRLALAVVEAIHPHFADGAWLVDLQVAKSPRDAPPDAEELARLIGATLQMPFRGGQPLAAQLFAYLHSRQLCLVLDNFEPWLPLALWLVELLQATRQVTLLVTSRMRLNLVNEVVYTLSGLATAEATDPTTVATSAASQLFIQAARQRDRHFALTSANSAAVAHLCRLVGGLPLALLIAATWIEHLTPAEIVSELTHDLRLLTTAQVDLPLRQRSIEQVLAIAWQALESSAQVALARLSIFVGTFSRQAAQAVAGLSLPLLRTLTDKALLSVDSGGRYRLHPLVQHFSRQQLVTLQPDESKRLEQQHAVYYAALVLRPAADATPVSWLRLLTEEYSNVCIALAWHWVHDISTALEIIRSLAPFWETKGYFDEGRAWLQKGLAADLSPSPARLSFLRYLGTFAQRQYDHKGANAFLAEALAIGRHLPDQRAVADVMHILGWLAWDEGQYAKARHWFEQSLASYQTLEDATASARLLNALANTCFPPEQSYAEATAYLAEALALNQNNRAVMASCLYFQAMTAVRYGHYTIAHAYYRQATAWYQGSEHLHALAWLTVLGGEIAWYLDDLATAQAEWERALHFFEQIQEPQGIALTTHNLAQLARRQKDLARATECYQASLRLALSIGYAAIAARALAGLGLVALAQEQPTAGAQRLVLAQQWFSSLQRFLTPKDEEEYATALASARAQLGEITFASLKASTVALDPKTEAQLLLETV